MNRYEYNRKKEFSFLKYFIKDNDLVFDVGANKGDKTQIYLDLSARVVCFEPINDCAEYLKIRFQNNNKVKVVNKGLSNEIATKSFYLCNQSNMISTFQEKWQEGRFNSYIWTKTIAEVTTLDSMIKDFGLPKFCKIDVEGYEYEVLKGLSKKVEYLSFEFAIEFIEDTKKCVEYLKTLGYKYFNFIINDDSEFKINYWASSGVLFHQIEKLALCDKMLWGDIWVYGKN